MIKPTVGRVIWYFKAGSSSESRPLAGLIAYVHSDTMINAGVFDENGVPFSVTSLPLLQEGDKIPEVGPWAGWMPYQVGQAKKAESAEALLDQSLGAMAQGPAKA